MPFPKRRCETAPQGLRMQHGAAAADDHRKRPGTQHRSRRVVDHHHLHHHHLHLVHNEPDGLGGRPGYARPGTGRAAAGRPHPVPLPTARCLARNGVDKGTVMWSQEALSSRYRIEGSMGKGSFGSVSRGRDLLANEVVAIKRVLQDPRFKNREVTIATMMDHCNVVHVNNHFYTFKPRCTAGPCGRQGERKDIRHEAVYLHLVMECMPETLFSVYRRAFQSQWGPEQLFDMKLYAYQLCRAMAYIHDLGVCHRDIKPQNILVDPATRALKVCDFGSAKVLEPNQPNVHYICSRYYRAPELCLGSTQYSFQVDVWSVGCVIAELFIGTPLFPGINADQLMHEANTGRNGEWWRHTQISKIIDVLGSPTEQDLEAIQGAHPSQATRDQIRQLKCRPYRRPKAWHQIFGRLALPPDFYDFISKLFCVVLFMVAAFLKKHSVYEWTVPLFRNALVWQCLVLAMLNTITSFAATPHDDRHTMAPASLTILVITVVAPLLTDGSNSTTLECRLYLLVQATVYSSALIVYIFFAQDKVLIESEDIGGSDGQEPGTVMLGDLTLNSIRRNCMASLLVITSGAMLTSFYEGMQKNTMCFEKDIESKPGVEQI